jgi:hypothetical protein
VPRARFNGAKSQPPCNNFSNNNLNVKKSNSLSEKEMVELQAAGKCFQCKETGHVAWNCPQLNTVKASGSKPPGIPSYSVQMEVLEDLSEHDKVLDSMPVGVITLMPDTIPVTERLPVPEPNWQQNYPIWQQPGILARKEIGDCYAMTTEYLWTIQQPYLKDNLWSNVNCRPDSQFSVTRLRKDIDQFRIIDQLTDFQVCVPCTHLDNLRFDLGHWYAKQRAKALNLGDSMKSSYKALME